MFSLCGVSMGMPPVWSVPVSLESLHSHSASLLLSWRGKADIAERPSWTKRLPPILSRLFSFQFLHSCLCGKAAIAERLLSKSIGVVDFCQIRYLFTGTAAIVVRPHWSFSWLHSYFSLCFITFSVLGWDSGHSAPLLGPKRLSSILVLLLPCMSFYLSWCGKVAIAECRLLHLLQILPWHGLNGKAAILVRP